MFTLHSGSCSRLITGIILEQRQHGSPQSKNSRVKKNLSLLKYLIRPRQHATTYDLMALRINQRSTVLQPLVASSS